MSANKRKHLNWICDTWILPREPVIETVITPKEGCKLVVRSSKSSGQEEYFVDALEVVSFGHSLFFRSQERPKAFLVPVSDYEILEVREARMVLKNVGSDRAIKIGGGRESPPPRLPKEPPQEREPREREPREPRERERESVPASLEEVPALAGEESATGEAGRLDKKRGRRHYRRRRGRDDAPLKEETSETTPGTSESELAKPDLQGDFASTGLEEGESTELTPTTSLILSSILPPPPTLISETIARYKDNAMFKGAFFVREEKTAIELVPGQEESTEQGKEPGEEQLGESQKEAWISDEAEEEIFRHRTASLQPDEPLPESPAGTHESADAKEGLSPNNN